MWSLTSPSLRHSTLPDLLSFSPRCLSVLTEYFQGVEWTSNHVQYSRANFQRRWVVTTRRWWLQHANSSILEFGYSLNVLIVMLAPYLCSIIHDWWEYCKIYIFQRISWYAMPDFAEHTRSSSKFRCKTFNVVRPCEMGIDEYAKIFYILWRVYAMTI